MLFGGWGGGGGSHGEHRRLLLPSTQNPCRWEGDSEVWAGEQGFCGPQHLQNWQTGSIICGYNWLTLRCMYLKSKTAYTPRMGAVGEGLEGLELDQADLEWLSGGGRFWEDLWRQVSWEVISPRDPQGPFHLTFDPPCCNPQAIKKTLFLSAHYPPSIYFNAFHTRRGDPLASYNKNFFKKMK